MLKTCKFILLMTEWFFELQASQGPCSHPTLMLRQIFIVLSLFCQLIPRVCVTKGLLITTTPWMQLIRTFLLIRCMQYPKACHLLHPSAGRLRIHTYWLQTLHVAATIKKISFSQHRMAVVSILTR